MAMQQRNGGLVSRWLVRSYAGLLPFADTAGRPFSYVLTDEALSMLHRIDQQAAGRIQMPEVVTNYGRPW